MKKIFLLLIALISFGASAGEWSGSTNVKRIYPYSNTMDGIIFVSFDEMKNPDGCAKSDNLVLRKSNVVFNEIYSLLLTAATTNKKVTYYVNGCDADYPKLLHVTLSF